MPDDLHIAFLEVHFDLPLNELKAKALKVMTEQEFEKAYNFLRKEQRKSGKTITKLQDNIQHLGARKRWLRSSIQYLDLQISTKMRLLSGLERRASRLYSIPEVKLELEKFQKKLEYEKMAFRMHRQSWFRNPKFRPRENNHGRQSIPQNISFLQDRLRCVADNCWRMANQMESEIKLTGGKRQDMMTSCRDIEEWEEKILSSVLSSFNPRIISFERWLSLGTYPRSPDHGIFFDEIPKNLRDILIRLVRKEEVEHGWTLVSMLNQDAYGTLLSRIGRDYLIARRYLLIPLN